MTLSLRAFTHQVNQDTGIDRLKKGDYVRVVTPFAYGIVECLDVDDLVDRRRTTWILHESRLDLLPWGDEVLQDKIGRRAGWNK